MSVYQPIIKKGYKKYVKCIFSNKTDLIGSFTLFRFPSELYNLPAFALQI